MSLFAIILSFAVLLAFQLLPTGSGTFTNTAYAATQTTTPHKVNFQARLTDQNGNIMPDGSYNIKFRLYDALTGGTKVWEEDYLVSSSQGVQMENGLFSVKLGSITTLSPSLFASNPNLYLEVELPSPATATSSSPSWSEGPMSPRQQLESAPYAMNADALDGIDSSQFARQDASNTFTQSNQFNGTSTFNKDVTISGANPFTVGTGATTLGGTLNVSGASTLNSLTVSNNATINGGTLTVGTATTSGKVVVYDSGFTATIEPSTLTGNRKFLLPDTSLATAASPGTICVYNGAVSNCPAATGSAFYIHNDTGLQADANFNIQAKDSDPTPGAGTIGGIIRGAAGGQTVDLFQLQSSGGTVLAGFKANGQLYFTNSGHTVTLAPDTLTGNHVLTLPDETGTICTDAATSACSVLGSYIQNQNAAAQVAADFWIDGTGHADTLVADTAVQTPSLDTGSAGGLTIGATNANAISIGKSGVDTTVNGGLTVAEVLTANGGSSLQGNTSIATTAGNSLTLGNGTGALAVTGDGASTFTLDGVTIDAAEFNLLDGHDTALIDTNDAVNTAITGVGTITSGVWNGTSLTDAYVDDNLTISSSGTVDWTALNNYPAACAAGSAITQLDDSVACSQFATGTAGDYIQNQNAAAQVAADFWIDGTGHADTLQADTTVQTPLLDTATAAALGIGTGNATNITIGHNAGTLAIDATNIDLSTAGVLTLAGGQAIDLSSNGATTLTIDAGGAAALNLGTANANAISIGKAGVTTTNNGALEVAQLLTGNAGAAISGADINLNTSSNFDTNINTGTSTGSVNIGNINTGDIALQSGGAISLTGGAASSFTTAAGDLTLQAGSGTVSLGSSSNLTAAGMLNIASGGANSLSVDTGGAAALSLGTANANAITVGQTGVTTTIQGDTAVTLNSTTATGLVCQNTSTNVLSQCDSTILTPTADNFIQNQTASVQTGGFNISGDGSLGGVLTVGGSGDSSIAGSLGIGTTTPGSKLDVDGDINASSYYLQGGQTVLDTLTGTGNTFVGQLAGNTSITGSYNVALGNSALNANSSGGNNTAVGSGALYSNTTGSGNTAVGFGADVGAGNLQNATAIGAYSRVDSSYSIVLGCTTDMTSFCGSNTNVGIDTSTPVTTLDVAGATSTRYNNVRTYQNVYSYGDGTGHTATYEIVLPANSGNGMVAYTIKGFDYATGGWQATITGGNNAGTWYNTSAQISGNAPFSTIRLAYSTTLSKPVILLGTTSTLWTFPQVSISQVVAGYGNQDNWGSGYSSAFLSSESGFINVQTPAIQQTATTSVAFLQGGNSFGTTATLGTKDSNDLVFVTNNTPRLTINKSTGDITAPGKYNTNTFNGSTLTFGSASAATVQSASGQALNITANAASTFKTSSGDLTIQAGGGANLNLNTSGAGTVNVGIANTTKVNIGSTAVTQVVLQAGSSSGNGVLVQSSSATALQIQNGTSGPMLFTANASTTRRVTVGTVGSIYGSSTTNGDLVVVGNTEVQGQLYVGGSASDAIYTSSGDGGALRFKGSARNTVTTTLSPEYSGAVMTGDGTSNVGIMTSDFCSNSSPAINTGICNTAGDVHNYYSWYNSNQPTAQNYDIYTRWQVPSNFDQSTNFPTITFYGWHTTSSDSVAVTLYSNGTACGTGTIASGTTAAWATATIPNSASCSLTPGSMVTLKVHLIATSGNYALVGEIGIVYKTVF